MKFKIYEDVNGEKGADILGGEVGIGNSHLQQVQSLRCAFNLLAVGQVTEGIVAQRGVEVYVLVERVS